MARFFNTSGPNNPAKHYTLSVLERLPGVRKLIDQELYFVLHAPRQVGKTTTLLSLAQELTAEGRYAAVLLSMEQGAPFRDDPGAAELAVLVSWRGSVEAWLPAELQPPQWPEVAPGGRLGAALQVWARASSRPLVVFLDEIDALQDDTLISVLRQIRAGFPTRPGHFPASLALIGLRDVRDYPVPASPGGKVSSFAEGRLGTSSPFNIKAESLTLRNFTAEEVASLYGQHTAETGQEFTPDAVARAFELTQGQPWLVNALARQLTEVLVPDPARAITAADVDEAKELLIRRQDTHQAGRGRARVYAERRQRPADQGARKEFIGHNRLTSNTGLEVGGGVMHARGLFPGLLDSLMDRLREPRIRALLEPMLAGETPGDVPEDDRRFAVDLGLLRRSPLGGLEVANPIYKEIIVRTLAGGTSDALPKIPTTWLAPDGTLDEAALLRTFLEFWRQHGEPLLKTAPYHEIAPHLVLMAFLHRVVNGGSIEREYAIGSGRMDLCLRYAGRTLAIEIKVWRPGATDPLNSGVRQLDSYLAGLGLSSGWLVIFDRRPDALPLADRTSSFEATTEAGRHVTVIRA